MIPQNEDLDADFRETDSDSSQRRSHAEHSFTPEEGQRRGYAPKFDPLAKSPPAGLGIVEVFIDKGQPLGFTLSNRIVFQVFYHDASEEDHQDEEVENDEEKSVSSNHELSNTIGRRPQRGDYLESVNNKQPPDKSDDRVLDKMLSTRPLKLKFYRRHLAKKEKCGEYEEVEVMVPAQGACLELEFWWHHPLVCIHHVGAPGRVIGFQKNDVIRRVQGEPITHWKQFLRAIMKKTNTSFVTVKVRRRVITEPLKLKPPYGQWSFLDGDFIRHFEIKHTGKLGAVFIRRAHNTALRYFENAGLWCSMDGKLCIERTPDGCDLNMVQGDGKMYSYCCWPSHEDTPFIPPDVKYPTTYTKLPPPLLPGGGYDVLDHWIYEKELLPEDMD